MADGYSRWLIQLREAIQKQVLDQNLTTSPASPTIGDRYIIAGVGGDWSGGTINDIAEFIDGTTWSFLTPTEGLLVYILDENKFYVFTTSWVELFIDWSLASQGTIHTTNFSALQNIIEDTTPQLGGSLDLNAKGITEELTMGATLSTGNLCYMNGSGRMALADADAEATADTLLAIATEGGVNGNIRTFLLFGKWTTSGLTAGAEYFISTTAGTWTTTRPSATLDIVRHIGTAISTTVLFFNPDGTYVEIA